MRQATLASTLALQVSEALVKVGMTQDDILVGEIKHTDLPWQIPPLLVEAPLFGVPLADYFSRSISVNAEALLVLWGDALMGMRNNPSKILDFDGYRSSSYVIPGVRTNERQLYLSLPAGFPHGIEDLAAVTLSLEAAHLLHGNVRVREFVSDDDNYYAVLPDGIEVGIKEGLPTVASDIWDMPVSGMVQEMLRMPRGAVWEGCDYDIIAKVRSVIWDYQKIFPEFEALDWALQALRVMDGQKEMLSAIYNLKKTAYNRKVRIEALADAVRVSNQLSISDRQRIELLRNLLVPLVITSGQFTKLIYSYHSTVPAMLAEKVLNRIRSAVQDMHDNEVSLYTSDPIKRN